MTIKHRIKRLEQKLAPGDTGALLLVDPTEEELQEARRKNPCALLILKNLKNYQTEETSELVGDN